jgi:cyclopropane-fatty-acyl-phospholipid synthase
MARSGASLTIEARGAEAIEIGPEPRRTRIVLRDEGAVQALLDGHHLALAEAYLHERIEVEGSLEHAIQVTDHLAYEAPSRLRELLWFLRFLLDRRGLDRRSISHHYDRPPDFFLAWLDETRSYTHGLYATPDDDLTTAQTRKLQYTIDALGLEPGMEVFDMGCGWGSFLEHAGAQGIRVQGITLSRDQHAFVSERIRAGNLPCRVECVDFLDYRPKRRFDAAVFMGSLEHLPDYRPLRRFLRDHLHERAGVYCDFVTSKEGRLGGAFMTRYIFPGVSNYVDVPGLLRALLGAGLNVSELADDTLSCAFTVRAWARSLERVRGELAARHGELTVRAFLLYLWSSYHFLATNRTQAYHLVASRVPLALPHPRAATSATVTATRHDTPNTSPTRP